MSFFSGRYARFFAILFFSTTVLLSAVLAGSWWYGYRMFRVATATPSDPVPTVLPSAQISPLEVQYRLQLPGGGEIFPALVGANPADYWPVATLSIINTSPRPVVRTVTARIIDWSRRETASIIIGPRETRTLRLNPELLPKAYQNSEIRRALFEVRVTSPGTEAAYSQNQPVFLHAVSDLYWGKEFANADFVARWVTPHDPAVGRLVSAARNYVPRGRLAGYNGNTPQHLAEQARSNARAVFEAMRRSRISYVDSMFTFGNFTDRAERIRLPRETLSLNSANCIDVSVAFASAMEYLGVDPVIVIVPGHAITGIRLGPESKDVLYLDLTVLPDGSFERAIARADYWLKRTPANQVQIIDIAAARTLGIYPLPEPLPERS